MFVSRKIRKLPQHKSNTEIYTKKDYCIGRHHIQQLWSTIKAAVENQVVVSIFFSKASKSISSICKIEYPDSWPECKGKYESISYNPKSNLIFVDDSDETYLLQHSNYR